MQRSRAQGWTNAFDEHHGHIVVDAPFAKGGDIISDGFDDGTCMQVAVVLEGGNEALCAVLFVEMIK